MSGFPEMVRHSPKLGEIFIARSFLTYPYGAYHDSASVCTVAPEKPGFGFTSRYLGEPPPRFNLTGGGDSLPMPEAEQVVWRKKYDEILKKERDAMKKKRLVKKLKKAVRRGCSCVLSGRKAECGACLAARLLGESRPNPQRGIARRVATKIVMGGLSR